MAPPRKTCPPDFSSVDPIHPPSPCSGSEAGTRVGLGVYGRNKVKRMLVFSIVPLSIIGSFPSEIARSIADVQPDLMRVFLDRDPLC